ncbi:MAG: DHH family phosphoesterase [Theionarchaea archaeon]|nr:DHH family phosphoesterase [Theionarchaea archaeon]MBU7000997.1 DHH family phosphoesterase [Theionarchaea archaeon]MBU7020986.1 DHH family phosphoesterase [Theionarchaea archaeon]MBU7034375.1 DHH family phosphoesterase [Theionarchaea archaeon]MBU7040061.1 DHH family phosphoesterase [Theionarchaea archaeon]
MRSCVLDVLERESSFLILIHSNADPDAVGSAVALKEFLKLKNKRAEICCQSVNRMGKYLLKNLGESIVSEDIPEADAVVILDTASLSQLGTCAAYLNDDTRTVVVIDHHRESSFTQYVYLCEDRTSTAEILFDLLPQKNKKINLALLGGILTDTGNFKYATRQTFQTVEKILGEGVELYEVFDMFSEHKNVPKRIAIIKGCQRSKLHKIGNYLVITTKVNSHESSTATFLTQVANVVFVANEKGSRIIAKASQDVDIDLSRIMKEIGQLYNGDGGGHRKAAGASGESISEALDHCVELVRAALFKKPNLLQETKDQGKYRDADEST